MFEVEVKVPAELDRVRRRLEAADAERLETIRQVDRYFQAPHRDLAVTDEAVRIREEVSLDPDAGVSPSTDVGTGTTGRVFLTYKGPKLEAASKTRRERIVRIDDPDEMAVILERLGFGPVPPVEKRRERWRLDDVELTLDRVAGLGEYVEAERTVDDRAAVDDARATLESTLERLGLVPDDGIRQSYLELLLARAGEQNGADGPGR